MTREIGINQLKRRDFLKAGLVFGAGAAGLAAGYAAVPDAFARAVYAAKQEGIGELWAAIEKHRHHLEATGRATAQAEQRLRDETAEVVAEVARRRAREALSSDSGLADRLLKDGTPYEVAEEILRAHIMDSE